MNKEIFRLALPNIISNISVPLLSTVDTALMGRLSEFHIGAVGLGSMIFNFLYWNFGFLRMGTTGLTAQAYGREDAGESILILARAGAIALGLAALILVLQWPFMALAKDLLQVEYLISGHVSTYFSIRVWAAPATLCLYALFGWFFGLQNALIPLALTLAINVVNIVMSYILVFQFDMEVAGVAWGTVIAQYVGLFLAIGVFISKYSDYLKAFRRASFLLWPAFRKFLMINRDIFLRTLFLTFAFGFFYSQSSAFGEIALAVNVILLQYLNWMSYGVDGFAYATESLVGKYYGKVDLERLGLAIKRSFFWAFVLAIFISSLYFFFGEAMLYVFTDQRDVIEAAMPFLIWMAIVPLAGTACYIWDGVFIGLTASRSMRNSMALAFVVYILAWYLLTPAYGNHGLWMALILFLLGRGVIQWIYYLRKGYALS